jgi:hypothetical protein
MTLELGKSGIPLGAYEEGAGSGEGGGASDLDQYLSGSTNASTTTLTVKNGKALDISAPTIAVGDNLVNNINGENPQLYLKQEDIEPGDNITVEQTSTGVKVSAAGSSALIKDLEAKIAALTERVTALEEQIGGGSAPTVTFSSRGATVKSGAVQSTTTLQSEQIGSVDFGVSGSATEQ